MRQTEQTAQVAILTAALQDARGAHMLHAAGQPAGSREQRWSEHQADAIEAALRSALEVA